MIVWKNQLVEREDKKKIGRRTIWSSHGAVISVAVAAWCVSWAWVTMIARRCSQPRKAAAWWVCRPAAAAPAPAPGLRAAGGECDVMLLVGVCACAIPSQSYRCCRDLRRWSRSHLIGRWARHSRRSTLERRHLLDDERRQGELESLDVPCRPRVRSPHEFTVVYGCHLVAEGHGERIVRPNGFRLVHGRMNRQAIAHDCGQQQRFSHSHCPSLAVLS